MELTKSGVEFIELTHQYFLGHLELQGITSTLIPAIFGDYTKDIPEETLKRAAQRGTDIHKELARIDEGESFAVTYEETEYERLRDELGLVPVANEYIVTDGLYFASAIDKVYEGDIIADVKTTSELHYPELTFQLSWYAAMFKEQNGRKVKKAYVVWLPKESYGKKCKIEEVKLVPATTIKKIVKDYTRGKDISIYAELFGAEKEKTPVIASNLPINVAEAVNGISTYEQQIKALDAQIKDIKAKRDELTAIALDYFHTSGEKKIEGEIVTITYIEPTIRTSVDSKALKADHPDLFEQYKKETVVNETVRVIIKK